LFAAIAVPTASGQQPLPVVQTFLYTTATYWYMQLKEGVGVWSGGVRLRGGGHNSIRLDLFVATSLW
jgi:hypothetical protein